ncbi:MAG: hypothetical protein QOF56_1695 [Acidobacteriaceae bacterium]|jgi:hypothetical protein|nr:hypothetical protein [Acidobacteriaceae bacterium]
MTFRVRLKNAAAGNWPTIQDFSPRDQDWGVCYN